MMNPSTTATKRSIWSLLMRSLGASAGPWMISSRTDPPWMASV